MSYQSATYNRTSGNFGKQLPGKDSSSNSTGTAPKTVVLNSPGVWMIEIFANIEYSAGKVPFQATIELYENQNTNPDPVQSIVTSATNYEFIDSIYYPSVFGATFSKTYVVNDANPSWTITTNLANDWPVAPDENSILSMKATKLC
jgi:hypothetical protein